MRVLFAIRDDDNIINSIVRKYKADFGKELLYKEANNFTAIIRELQENNDYDRIIVSDDFDKRVNQSDEKEAILFKKLKGLLSVAKGKNGKEIPVIFLANNRRIAKVAIDNNIYNFLVGKDITKKNIYELMKKSRNKSQANEYHKLIFESSALPKIGNETKKKDKISGTKNEKITNASKEVPSVEKYIKYFKKENIQDDKCIDRFEKACSQLSRNNLIILVDSLNAEVRKVLRKNSPKFKKIEEKIKEKKVSNKKVAKASEGDFEEKVEKKSQNNITERKQVAKREEKSAEPEVKKRGRGRPRKVVNPDELVAPKVKRGRGRPRKNPIEKIESVDKKTEELVDKKAEKEVNKKADKEVNKETKNEVSKKAELTKKSVKSTETKKDKQKNNKVEEKKKKEPANVVPVKKKDDFDDWDLEDDDEELARVNDIDIADDDFDLNFEDDNKQISMEYDPLDFDMDEEDEEPEEDDFDDIEEDEEPEEDDFDDIEEDEALEEDDFDDIEEDEALEEDDFDDIEEDEESEEDDFDDIEKNEAPEEDDLDDIEEDEELEEDDFDDLEDDNSEVIEIIDSDNNFDKDDDYKEEIEISEDDIMNFEDDDENLGFVEDDDTVEFDDENDDSEDDLLSINDSDEDDLSSSEEDDDAEEGLLNFDDSEDIMDLDDDIGDDLDDDSEEDSDDDKILNFEDDLEAESEEIMDLDDGIGDELDDDSDDDEILNFENDLEDESEDIMDLDDGISDNLDDDAEEDSNDDGILNFGDDLDDDSEEDSNDDGILNFGDDLKDESEDESEDIMDLDDGIDDDLDEDSDDDGLLSFGDDLDDDSEDILNLDDDSEDIMNLEDDSGEDILSQNNQKRVNNTEDSLLDFEDESDNTDDGLLNFEDDSDDDILDLDLDDTADEDSIEDDSSNGSDDIMNLDEEYDNNNEDDLFSFDSDDDKEDFSLNADNSLKIKDGNSFSGIRNKNYTTDYDISKQISAINGDDDSDETSVAGNTIEIGDNQNVVAFVGSHNSGNSFLVNNLGQLLSEQGVKTAIVDLTKNKNSYYIYTENEENMRNIAYSSFEKLKSGIADGIKVNKNLTVYTALPNSDSEIEDKEIAMSTLLNNYSLILLDCDFDTDLEYFSISQDIFFVQSFDILTIQGLTSFIKKLKMNKVEYENKMKVVINKHVSLNSINERAIVAAVSVYNSPDTTYQLDLFDRNKVEYVIVPFEEKNYCKYLDDVVKCKLTIRGYSKNLINSLNKLAKIVYPINGKKYKAK